MKPMSLDHREKRRFTAAVLFVAVVFESISFTESVRVVGGDGVVFHFNGRRDRDFCLISDADFHINAHMVGRMYNSHAKTWINSLAVLVGNTHVLFKAFTEPSWDPFLDHVQVWVNGTELHVPAPGHKAGPQALPGMWESNSSDVRITRPRVNEAKLEVRKLLDVRLRATPGEEDLRTEADCFVHFDVEFRNIKISRSIHGVLGQTYRPQRIRTARMRARHNNDNYNSVDVAVLGKKRGPAISGLMTDYLSSGPWATDCKFSKFAQTGASRSSNQQTAGKTFVSKGISITRGGALSSSATGGEHGLSEDVNPLEAYFSENAVTVIRQTKSVVEEDGYEAPDVFADVDAEPILTEREGYVVDIKAYEKGAAIDDSDMDTIPSGLSLVSVMNE